MLCQVEMTARLAEIQAIASAEGVDIVQMELLDLSMRILYLWDLKNQKARELMKEAERG